VSLVRPFCDGGGVGFLGVGMYVGLKCSQDNQLAVCQGCDAYGFPYPSFWI
jgi:hypothetical protein